MKLFNKRNVLPPPNGSNICRICLDDDNPMDIISPCLCTGGSEFVHRNCLDNWRSLNKGGRAFEYCDVCQFKFIIEPREEDQFADRKRLWLFRFLITRDITLIMLLIQGIIIGLAFLLRYLDRYNHTLINAFPHSMTELGVYYLSGLILFLAFLGLFGLIAACCGMLADREIENGSGCRCYSCFWFGYGCNNCNGGSNCNSGGNGGGALGIVILVLAALGIIVGIILSIIIVRKIVKRHMTRLWLRQETKKYIVKDFRGRRNELPTDNIVRETPMSLSVTNLMNNNIKSNKTSFAPIHSSNSTSSTVQ